MQCGLLQLAPVDVHHDDLRRPRPGLPVVAHLADGDARTHGEDQVGVLDGPVAGTVAHVAGAAAVQRMIVLDQVHRVPVGHHRYIQLLQHGSKGVVAAGQPILAQENIESYFPIPAEIVPSGESFALRVRGDSMINAGIFNGDLLFVNSCNTARNGDIVVALIEDGATVKTFYKENGYIRLQPENDAMEPIIVDSCVILGKVFGVFRTM